MPTKFHQRTRNVVDGIFVQDKHKFRRHFAVFTNFAVFTKLPSLQCCYW